MKKQTLCKKAFLLFAFIPIMMQAQNNNQAARIDKTDDFKLEFHYSDKVLAQQSQTDLANNQQQLVVNSFAASNPQWKLSKVEIDQSLLSNNSSNYSSLLSEAKASFSKDIIYVENAAKAHIDALEMLTKKNEISGETYFIGQEKPVKLWEFINLLLEKSNQKKCEDRVSFKLAYFVGFVLEILYKI